MSVFNDVNGQRSLYVSGVGAGNTITLSSVPPPSLLRSSDGIHFTPVPADPGTTLGNINKAGCCFRGQTTYDGKFIVVIGTIQGAGAVFSSTDPRVGDNNFLQITPSNMQVFEIEPFNGHLYLGVQSLFGGYEVLRTDCVTPPADQKGCPMSDFTTVVPPGGGLGSKGNFSITSMHVFTDTNGVPHLYVGTNGSPQGMPAEIVRINQDDSWDLVVGTPRLVNGVLKSPLSGLGQGFGWPFNWHMWRMEDYQGILYVGTFDASTIYRNSSIGSQLLPYMGFDLWASRDGRTFLPVSINGFGEKFSFGARSLTATPYGLFVGSANYYYGLRIWQGKLSPDALHLAPTNLRPMPAAAPTSVALTWDAPSTATLFHVYRATERQQTIPSLSDAEAASIGLVNRRPQLTWMPGAFTEVGTTTARSFRDRGAWAGGHYIYYVVAQDAEGNLSAASNAIAMPALMPAQ